MPGHSLCANLTRCHALSGLAFGASPTAWNSNGGGFGVQDMNADGSIGMHFLNHGDKPLYRLTDADKAAVFEVRWETGGDCE